MADRLKTVVTVDVAHVAEQELVAHIFAPLSGPAAGHADEAIRLMWSLCGSVLRMTGPISPTGLSDQLPDDFSATPDSGPIAARQSPDTDFQAVLRREHDVLNLSVLLARCHYTAGEPRWQAMDRQLDAVIGNRLGPLIGVARLYLAKVAGPAAGSGPATAHGVPASARLGAALAALLPADAQHAGWWHHGQTLPAGLAAWEISASQDARIERRIVVVARPGADARLSAWTWSRGDPPMPPFARYLMHIAKIRYELRVRHGHPPVAGQCQRIHDSIADIRGLAEAVTADRRGPAEDRSQAVAARIAGLRTERVRLTETRTALRAMQRTVEIAAANAAAALGADGMDRAGDHLIGDDLTLASWLGAQLDDDVAYLDAALDGANQVTEIAAEIAAARPAHAAPPAAAFGIITALAEEFTAMRALIDDPQRMNVDDDGADYVLGTMPSRDPDQPHRVVLTLLGTAGNDAAAVACANLLRSFSSVGFVLMVGIAAGVPDPQQPDRHVRLGDVVVATWGIVDYDHVIDTADGPVGRQPFPRPSPQLARRASMLEADEQAGRRPWEPWLVRATAELPEFGRPPEDTDVIYAADVAGRRVPHPDPAASGHRPGWPKVHYGLIGSGDRSLRSARSRDELAARHGLLAVEMEGKGIGNAGFAHGREWLVVRGISDYGDRRTGRRWRRYASVTAAAYTRALLAECPPITNRGGHPGAVAKTRPAGLGEPP